MLQREVANIKELHEAEPDSKWCMNALSHYLLLLARLPSTPDADKATLRADAKVILERLAVIDEDRKERYRELGKSQTTRITSTNPTSKSTVEGRTVEWDNHF